MEIVPTMTTNAHKDILGDWDDREILGTISVFSRNCGLDHASINVGPFFN